MTTFDMSAETVQQMAIALAVITSASAINRFYVRLRISHAVSVADWTILLALLLYLSLCMVTSMLASLSRAAMLYHKLSFVLYALAATATKINIGTWIPAPKLWPSGMLVTTPCLVCQALLTIAVIAIIFMPCEATTTSICYADADAYSTLAWATLNAVSTVILLITGVRRIVVDRQKISTRLRAVAAAVSLLGLGSLAAAITTALFFAQTLTISLPITSTESFSNESSLRTAIPALLDVALAIICACTLVLQPQFARWLPLHATTASSPLRPRRPSSSTSSSSPSRSSSVVSKWSEKSIIFIPEIVVTPPTPEVSRPTLLPRLQDPRNDAAKRRDRSGPTTRHHPQRPRLGRRQEAAAIYQWRNPADIIADPSLAWRADAEKPAEVCVVTRELREGEESPPLNRMPSEVEAKAIYFVTGAPLPYKAQDCWVRPGQGFMRDTV